MTTTCANCRAEVGDAAFCTRCGHAVLSPQSAPDWRTDTFERPAARVPVEPPPAVVTPGAPRFPLYADDSRESVAAHLDHEAERAAEPTYPTYSLDDPEEDDNGGRGVLVWLPWVVVALVMVLVAAGGVWLLLSAGAEETATDAASSPATAVQEDVGDAKPSSSPAAEEPSSSAPTPSASVPAVDPVDVGATAVATAPRSAPPNQDAFGNRTTYVAANMLDGRPDTCWRTSGDGTGLELSFRLAAPTAMTRVGLVNGYAKSAVVGGRTLDWYVGNRRVLAVQWVFDDGTTVDQPLGATTQMQTVDLGSPVTTTVVRLRLVAVSSPGTGRSARDYTAVSEVALVGAPTS